MDVYWLAQSESSIPLGNGWLSDGEVAVLERLRIPKRRADWRLGRWTAKRAIAAYLRSPQDAEALAAIEVRPALSGAPQAFIGAHRNGLSLSLSHSDGVGFCAIASASPRLGCDVEQVTPHSQAFLADYFTAGEQDLVARSPATHRDLLLTLLWSAKESALKALQFGLRSDTRSVTAVPAGFPPSRDEVWHPLMASHSGGQTFLGWWRRTGDLIWTLVAIPSPLPPIALSPAPAV